MSSFFVHSEKRPHVHAKVGMCLLLGRGSCNFSVVALLRLNFFQYFLEYELPKSRVDLPSPFAGFLPVF